MDIELADIHKKIVEEMQNKYEKTVDSLTHKRRNDNLIENKTDDSK